MNCPNCHASIGGHVQVGTEAYNRVSKGLCPNCGCGMPAGYKVDFLASSGRLASDERAFQEIRRKVDADALKYAPTNYKQASFHCFLGGIGVFLLLYMYFTMWEQPRGPIIYDLNCFMYSLFGAMIAWKVPVWVIRWHYEEYVEGRNDPAPARTNSFIGSMFGLAAWFIIFLTVLIAPLTIADRWGL